MEDNQNSFKKIISVVLWIAVIAWIFVIGYDYYNVKNNNKPKFCVKEETRNQDNGTIYICKGIGYKYYEYNTDSVKGTKFGGFWISEELE